MPPTRPASVRAVEAWGAADLVPGITPRSVEKVAADLGIGRARPVRVDDDVVLVWPIERWVAAAEAALDCVEHPHPDDAMIDGWLGDRIVAAVLRSFGPVETHHPRPGWAA